jgi:hypothetical protein
MHLLRRYLEGNLAYIFKCTLNGHVLLTDVLNTFLETLQRVMFVFRMWADNSKLRKYTCDILRANFLNNQEGIMCDKEFLNPHAKKNAKNNPTESRRNLCRS